MFCFLFFHSPQKKFVQQIVQKKFVLTTHEKNKKFNKPMECFMPEGRKNILFGSTMETNYCLVSEMEKIVC